MQDRYFVAPANAGAHNHKCQLLRKPPATVQTTTAAEYGSPLSRGTTMRAVLSQGRQRGSHRHLAVPHRGAGGDGFGGVDDGVGVDAVVAVEIVDRPGLPEMLDAERFDLVAAHAAEPAEGGGMTVDHGDDAAVARQRRQQVLRMAEMWHAAAVAAEILLARSYRQP